MQYNERIGEATNQAVTKQEILYSMANSDFSAFMIIGPDGSGKKTITEKITDSWYRQTQGEVICLNAPYKIPAEEFSVFQNIQLQTSLGKEKIMNVFLETLKDIPHVGNSFSAIVSELIKYVNNRTNVWDNFSYIEQLILTKLKKHIGNKPVIFVANNFELWDSGSQNLLYQIIQKQHNYKTFIKAYFIINTSSKTILFNGLISKTYYIYNIKMEDLNIIVNEINPKINLSISQMEHLFALTNGNLRLVLETLKLFDLQFTERKDSLFDIIKAKINNESQIAAEVIHLLMQTAFIGESVDAQLLKIFSTREVNGCYEDVLEHTVAMKLLCNETYTVSFAKRFIYDIFKEHTFKSKKYYFYLSKCIQILYPTRYDWQIKYLYRGGLYEEAAINFFLYSLKYFRENNIEFSLDDTIKEQLATHQYFDIYFKIKNGYKLYKKKKYEEAEETLFSLYCPLPQLRFEIEYLKSLIITNKYFILFEFQERIDTLEIYITKEFEKNFPEMYIRALMILIEFYSEVENNSGVDNCKKKINTFFVQYSSTDEQIRYYEHCFKMKANIYYKIEIATKYTKDAYLFFADSEHRKYHISKYYLAILNHSGNSIVMGDYANAYNMLLDAIEIVKNNPFLQDIQNDILVNNLAISGFLSNSFTALDCAKNLEEIISNTEEAADHILIQSNYAVFMALSGELINAHNFIYSLYEDISNMDNVDDYYQYYIINNYCILSWLIGQKESAQESYKLLLRLNPLPRDTVYFKRRTQYLYELFESEIPGNIVKTTNWNSYLVQKYPKTIGKAWKFWGNLLLLSELQIWSDF